MKLKRIKTSETTNTCTKPAAKQNGYAGIYVYVSGRYNRFGGAGGAAA